MVEKTDSTRQEKTSRKLYNTKIKNKKRERERQSSEQEFFTFHQTSPENIFGHISLGIFTVLLLQHHVKRESKVPGFINGKGYVWTDPLDCSQFSQCQSNSPPKSWRLGSPLILFPQGTVSSYFNMLSTSMQTSRKMYECDNRWPGWLMGRSTGWTQTQRKLHRCSASASAPIEVALHFPSLPV